MALSHNSKLSKPEPSWGSVDKTKLPRQAHANQGEPDKKSTWGYPHHWVKGGTQTNEDGVYTNGDMYLHEGGLNAAWAAAQGARTGQKASQSIKNHLQTHRKALGKDKEEQASAQESPLVLDAQSRAQKAEELKRYGISKSLM